MNQPLQAGDRLRLELKGHQPISYAFKPGEAPPTFPFEPVFSEELIDSVPPGATVVLDEKPLEGVTPLRIRWNQGQSHRLTLTLGDLGKAVDFAPGEVPGGRAFELKPATTAETRPEPSLDPNAPGVLKVAGAFTVHVKVDGVDRGELAPGAKLSLPPGPHRLELASARHFYKEVRTVSMEAGQTLSLSLPGLAKLTVETNPGVGKVFVDGVDAGIESDGSSVQVVHGRHTITVRGLRGIKTATVEVRGDTPVSIPL
jgi:hypothetical protein